MFTRAQAVRAMRRQHGTGAVGFVWQHPTAGYWAYSTLPSGSRVAETGVWGTTPVVNVERVGPDTAE